MFLQHLPVLQELALSIASSTIVNTDEDLCHLLAVSKGLRTAILSKGGSLSRLNVPFVCCDLAHTQAFASWMQKYHMLVKRLDLFGDFEHPTDDRITALMLGLRAPVQLESLDMSHAWPLKLLQQVDAQQLTTLRLSCNAGNLGTSVQTLATELGRFSKLQDLYWDDQSFELCSEQLSCSCLAQLTALRRLTVLEGPWLPEGWQHTPSQLQYLECDELDDVALSNMHHLRQLKELKLIHSYVTDTALAAAAKCWTQLQALMISCPHPECSEQLVLANWATIPLQHLDLIKLPNLTQEYINNIAQATQLTTLRLYMRAKEPITDPLQAAADAPTTLDLSGLTTLEQLQHLDVRCSFDSPSVTLTSFGDTLDRLTRLRSLSLNVVLHEQALAQVRVNYQCMCTVGYLRKCSNMRVSLSAGAGRHQSSATGSVLLAARLLHSVSPGVLSARAGSTQSAAQ
jgi:hypothetical protein